MKKPSKKEFVRELDGYVADRDEAKYKEHGQLSRDLRTAREAARAAEAAKADLERRLGFYEKLETVPLAVPEWLAPKGPTKAHHGIPSVVIGDWHSGEWVQPEQVGGINAYNRAICDARLQRAFEGTVTVARDYLKGVEYDGVQIFFPGDNVSGNLHEELIASNEGTVFENVMSMAEGFIAGLRLLAKEFGKANAACVVGNHGRRTMKPVYKNRAQDSFDWLIYRVVERELRADKRITMQVSPAMDAAVTIYNTRFLLVHGDEFRGGGGISAELAPLLLGIHRKTRQKQAEGAPFDCAVLGHFHSLLFLPSKSIVVTGCGIGPSEYGYGKGYTPEPPQCALFLTTPERGISAFAPVFVADKVSEGW